MREALMNQNRTVAVVAASGGSALCGSDGTKSPTPDVLVHCERGEQVRPLEAQRPNRSS
jgi:hypothetical protein